MLTTEAEAKTKRCQESFAAATMISANGAAYATTWQALPPSYGHNPVSCGGVTTAVQTAPSMCLGSACMAWRWGKLVNVYTPTDNPLEFTLSQELGGYCGKAGKPIQLDMKDES